MTKTLFDHLNQMYQKKEDAYYDSLSDDDKKSFNIYMINRFFSMNMRYVNIVNTLQQYSSVLTGREVFLFYNDVIPKYRQFSKYIKRQKVQKEDFQWVIDLIAKHFFVSQYEAEVYLELFSKEKDKESIQQLCELYGIDPKQIAKMIKHI